MALSTVTSYHFNGTSVFATEYFLAIFSQKNKGVLK